MRRFRAIFVVAFIALVGAVLLVVGVILDREIVTRSGLAAENGLAARARLAARLVPPPPWAPGEELREAVGALAISAGARVMLVGPGGRVVADSAANPNWTPTSAELQSVIASAIEHSAITRRSQPLGIALVHAAVPFDGPHGRSALLLTVPWDPGTATRRELRTFLLLAFAVAALLVLVLSTVLTRPMQEALERIRTAVRAVRAGDLSARVRQVTPGPLAEFSSAVNEAIDYLAGRLAESGARSRQIAAILEQMTDAVVAVDARGHVSFINAAFARLFDADPQTAVGRRLENVAPSFELGALVARARTQGAVQRDELRLSHPRELTLEAVAAPLRDESGAEVGAVALLHDLTGVRELGRMRQEFVANAGHELRTPAAAIKALAEALQAGALTDPGRGPRFLEQIVAAADRLTEIVDDMMTLTRVERGGKGLEPRRLRASEPLEDAAAAVRPAARAREIEITTEVPDDAEIFADPESLRTLIVNLLDNAVKYSPEGGHVVVRGQAAPGGFEVAVIDTGIGIPPEHHARIFERFYRVDRARDRATGSTGLGLAIVKHVAEAHGGSVRVESAPGQGSTFTAFFPEQPARSGRNPATLTEA